MVFLIHNSDGDTTVEPLEEHEFVRRLNEHYYGDAPRFIEADSISGRHDTNDWAVGAYLVIRGEIVMPQPNTTVITYTLDSPKKEKP